jgi:queuine tRNA-ribosyltransferase
MTALRFEVLATDGAARRGRLATACGTVETPAFMPVGTAATVKALTVDMLAATGAEIALCNTYHLMLRPGAERIARLGGLHPFMRRLPGHVAGGAAQARRAQRRVQLAP